MKRTLASLLLPLAASLSLGAAVVSAQQPPADPARPRNAAANLPSDTGSQTTNPSGAVTGAGQPQGTNVQRDVGNPGGLERRARREARGAEGTGGTRGTGAGAAAGAGATDARDGATPAQRTRARRASKG